jgi:hypothetical protein
MYYCCPTRFGGRRDRMVVGFTTIYICNQCLSALTLWVRIPLRGGVLNKTFWNKVGQWLAAGRWFSPGTPVSSTNKTDWHGITEILLKVVLNTIKPYILLSNTISVSNDGTAYHSGTSEFAPKCFTCLNGVRVGPYCQIKCFHVSSSVLRCPLRFSSKIIFKIPMR